MRLSLFLNGLNQRSWLPHLYGYPIKKIATDEMTCVNGAEPESIEETETWADGINAENHLPTFTRNVRLVPVTHLVLSSNRIRNAFTKANFNIFNIC